MAITCLSILLATLVVASTYQAHSAEKSSTEESDMPIIQNVNKNMNVIVNVDSKDVAKELWKIIESRLNNQTNTTSSKSIKKDLEEAVIPLVSPSRRGSTPSAFQVANQLDKITRRALTRNKPDINMLDEEIMTRDIVADMMVSLKTLSKQNQSKTDKNQTSSRRMMTYTAPISNEDEEDDYVDVRIKMLRKDILDVLH